MRVKTYRGRAYDACWTRELPDVFRATADGAINQKTGDTFATLEAAEDAADAAAQAWIDNVAGRG
ncbi:MAG: hypothetical protein EOP14_05515 [Pseudomonas sp.]|nr:MAG: hypothetical protein EOP14_05515 [Pseudomonas sp.]